MDKLFSRKRSASIAARHKEQHDRAKSKDETSRPPAPPPPATLKKSATTGGGISEKKAGKRKEAVDAAFGVGAGAGAGAGVGAGELGTRRPPKVGDKAPSLDVDIRYSLMLPGLSQRFSVLLPKISTAPETSLRSLLASQRERHDGPSLTLEEEEMLFAEIRETHDGSNGSVFGSTDGWDGSPPSTAWRGHSQDYLSRSHISASTSSPSILSLSSDGTATAFDRNGSNQNMSPPPTSTSFSSFQTFGHSQAQKQPRSYGFSGGSGMRDQTYLRKMASNKNLSGSVSSRKSGRSDQSNETISPHRETSQLPDLPTSQGSLPSQRLDDSLDSPNGSSHTATPRADPIVIQNQTAKHSPSASASFDFAPRSGIPTADQSSSGSSSKKNKRQSHLAGLSQSQQKRISRALLEIDHELRRDDKATQITSVPIQEEEEVLEPEDNDHRGIDIEDPSVPQHQRRPSYPESDQSSLQSQHSAPFPFGLSPARSERPVVEQPSPTARLPPSPRVHNLSAQVEGSSPPEEIPPLNLARKVSLRNHPTPILTPSKTQPHKYAPSPSGSSPSAVSPVPGYIPGQPRPVGSMHRSEGSVSSRSATPTNNTTPTTSVPPSNQSSISNKGHLRAGSTPVHQPPVSSRNAALNRSRSVNQGPDPQYDNDDSPSKPPSSFNHSSQRMLIDREAPTSRRPSSLLSIGSPTIIEEEGEDRDNESMHREPTPDIQVIPQRKEMSRAPHDPQHHIQEAGGILGWKLKSGKGDTSRVVSEQGFIDGTGSAVSVTGAAPSALVHETQMRAMSPEGWQRTLRQAQSRQSLSSDYAADERSEHTWADLFTATEPSSESDSLQTPSAAVLSDTLRQLSGLGKDDVAALQDRLVAKAKAERQAIRDDSPTMRDSPIMQNNTLPKRSASLARGHSPLPPSSLSPEVPPSAWRRPSADRSSPIPTPADQSAPPRSLAGLFTPPSTATTPSTANTMQQVPPHPAHANVPEPLLPSTQTPSVEGHDEIVSTPQSEQLSRNPSGAAREHSKVPLSEDPEVRRDFEARIAAATAALNRTPSIGGAKLERKPTKKGAAMVISSPKLVSSSTTVTGTPLTPPESSLDPAMRKALEKASGGGKSSGRWRKLGFRRGPSLSSQTAATAEDFRSPIPPTPPLGTSRPVLGATPTTKKKLEEAIDLPPGSAISPDLDNFKFPPLANRTAKNPALRDRPISPPMPYQPTMQQVAPPPSAPLYIRAGSASPVGNRSDLAPPIAPPSSAPILSNSQAVQQGMHSHTSSSDSAMAKFIESGRALGMNQEQLDQMLVANGMLDRSATTASSRSYQSTAPTTTSFSHSGHSHNGSQSQKATQATSVSQPPNVKATEDKPSGGLFRSFSKGRKAKNKNSEASDPNLLKANNDQEPPPTRNMIVRRTLLVPHDEPKQPTTPTAQHISSSNVPESPDFSRQGGVAGRKQSIKRKPLNLTREDHELVISSSPSAHRRNFSTGTTHSGRSDGYAPDQATIAPLNKGLGFLHPPLGNSTRSTAGGSGSSLGGINESPGDRRRSSDSRRRSSTGGSLYDLYGGDDSTGQDSQEFLRPDASPGRRVSDEGSRHSVAPSNQAVEICEYADGRVVWSLVDGLRDGDEEDLTNPDYSYSNHSRQDSFTSNASSRDDISATPAGPWPGKGNYNTPALNLRHRDRGSDLAAAAAAAASGQPRPETFVYRADTRDVADLIDHLSRDLDPSQGASRGRIDFSHLYLGAGAGTGGGRGSFDGDETAQSSPFPYSATPSRAGDDGQGQSSSPDPRFADPPSPEPTSRIRYPANPLAHHRAAPPPPPIVPPSASAQVPAGGFSPKRQMMLRQGLGFGAHRANVQLGLGGNVIPQTQSQSQSNPNGMGQQSPSGVSFASSSSGGAGAQRTVEERLQNLLDRLKSQNDHAQAQAQAHAQAGR